MKLFFKTLAMILAITGISFAQTRPVVPREAGEGSLGKPSKGWGEGYFSNSLTLNGETIYEIPEVSQKLFCLETNMNKGDKLTIPGTVVSIYDNSAVEETIPFYFNSTNVTLVEQDNWKGTVTTLTVASDGATTGAIDGMVDPRALPGYVWMTLKNSDKKFWITSINQNINVTWIHNADNYLYAGDYEIDCLSPITIDEHYGYCYGNPTGTNNTWVLAGGMNTMGYSGITTPDGSNVWVSVENGGKIYKSRNFGEDGWKEITATMKNWRDIETIDGQIIWGAVYGGKLQRSEDGGVTWHDITNSVSRNWLGISTLDNTNIYASVYSGRIYKSEDAGETWTDISGVNRNWAGIKILDPTNIFCCAYGDKLYASTNGGTTWEARSTSNYNWYDIDTLDGTNFFAACNGFFLRSEDCGKTWQQIQGSGNGTGIIVRPDGEMMICIYNGQLWRSAPNCTTKNNTWLGSTNRPCHATIFNYKGNGFERLQRLDDWSQENPVTYSYPAFQTAEDEWSVWSVHPTTNYYIVGETNIEYEMEVGWWPIAKRYSNDFWKVRSPPINLLERVEWVSVGVTPSAEGSDGVTVYAAVDGGTIWRSTDGGNTWTSLNSGSQRWWGVATADGVTVYAAVYNGTIWKSTDGGNTWTSLNSGSRYWVGVATADGVTVYAAESGGTIWKSDNSGTGWTQTQAPLEKWQAIAVGSNAVDGVTVYAAVWDGTIWRSTDGGNTWTSLNSGSRNWRGVATADGVTVYAAVENGTIWKSTDGGNTWTSLNSGSRSWQGVATADGVTVYAAVYNGGTIWRTDVIEFEWDTTSETPLVLSNVWWGVTNQSRALSKALEFTGGNDVSPTLDVQRQVSEIIKNSENSSLNMALIAKNRNTQTYPSAAMMFNGLYEDTQNKRRYGEKSGYLIGIDENTNQTFVMKLYEGPSEVKIWYIVE